MYFEKIFTSKINSYKLFYQLCFICLQLCCFALFHGIFVTITHVLFFFFFSTAKAVGRRPFDKMVTLLAYLGPPEYTRLVERKFYNQ